MRIKFLVLTCFLTLRLSAAIQEPQPTGSLLDQYNLIKAPEPAALLLKKGDRLAICGDSITEQKKYSRIMEDYLTACMPELEISVRQFGWGGERADGFLKRMTNDCLRFKPTIATTSYGMNDHGYQPYKDSIGDAYRSNMQAVVRAFKAHGVRVVLGSPGTITKVPWWEAGKYQIGDLNQSLGRLRNIDVEIAQQENVGFADVYVPMLLGGAAAKQKYGEKYELNSDDGIHPDWAGHTVMAYAFLKALGVSGQIASFTVDLKANELKVSAGHKLLSSGNGEFEIRSTRYPFCFAAPPGLAANWYPTAGSDNPTNNDNLRSGMTLVPFNEELNRFMLTVTNTTAEKYRVTWGDQSKVFTSGQLSRGVNLAEEFMLNPFSERFARIDAAVSDKQDFETRQIKVLFRVPGNQVTMEQITAQTEKVLADTEREHAALEAVIRTTYAPVTYTIKITAE
jgi:lysophospholipase L1-like esterase